MALYPAENLVLGGQSAQEVDPLDVSLASIPPAQDAHGETTAQPPAGQGAHIEADSLGDNDSALGDDEQSMTTSIESSIRDYRIEHGRSYHKYKDGQYAYPNDEAEKDRYPPTVQPFQRDYADIIRDLMHHLHNMILGNRLYLAPIPSDVQNVLDIGTGTGIWAIEFADEHPSALVVGTDLSPIQPSFIPPNLSFIVDDANDEWVFKQNFDFIHARQLHCAVEEMKMIRQAFDNLQPGGWFELQDLTFPVGNDDNTLTKEHAVYKWSEHMLEASRRTHQDLDNPPKYAQWMSDAGFININHVFFKCPANPWPKDKKMKTLGMWHLANTLDGLEGFTMAIFTRVLGWQPEEVQVFLAGVREDTKNRQIHNYWPVYVSYGQKPL